MQFKKTISSKLPLRFKNRIKALGCLACGATRVDLDHIRTRGAVGADYELEGDKCYLNVMPLCRKCHIHRHKIGIKSFIKKYEKVKIFVDSVGILRHKST